MYKNNNNLTDLRMRNVRSSINKKHVIIQNSGLRKYIPL